MLVDLGGWRVAYEEAGDPAAPAVVFVHGFPFSRRLWARQLVAAARAGWRAVAYDLRGFGDSEPGDGQYTMDSFADDLFALLDRLGLPRAALCGLSMGGYVALRAAERAPERLLGLLLCDTRSEGDDDAGRLARAAAMKAAAADRVAFAAAFLPKVLAPATLSSRPDVVAAVRGMIDAASLAGIRGALLAMAARTETGGALARLDVPVWAVAGELDLLTPPALAKGLAARARQGRALILDGAAHVSNLEDPDGFDAALTAFLGACRP